MALAPSFAGRLRARSLTAVATPAATLLEAGRLFPPPSVLAPRRAAAGNEPCALLVLRLAGMTYSPIAFNILVYDVQVHAYVLDL